MIVIFEDNESVATSILLKKLEDTDFKIQFANGNRRLAAKVRENYVKYDDIIVVYIDVVTDNDETKKIYNILTESYLHDDRVIILPIPCMEFILFRMFNRLCLIDNLTCMNIELRRLLLDVLENKYTGASNYKSLDLQTDSFEGICKQVLGILVGNSCLHNKQLKLNKEFRTRFYTANCLCDNNYCTVTRDDISLTMKVCVLYSSLLFYYETKECIKNLGMQPVRDFDYVLKFYKSFYTTMKNNVGNGVNNEPLLLRF